MATLQELQAPIDAAIINAMIESTPETWCEIVLTLSRAPGDMGIGSFLHEFASPEGHAPVGPAESLYDATYKLDALIQSAGRGVISKAVYVAKSVGDKWSYQATFEYL